METKSGFERFCWLLAQHQLKVLVLVLVITAVFGVGISRMRTEVILSEMFPYDHPYLKFMGRFGQVFGGGGSGVVIAVKVKKGDIFNEKTLTKIKNMTSEVELWDEVYRVLTVSMASNSTKVVNAKGKGEITIEALMFPDVPKTPEAMELLKKNIFSNPAYNGSLVSKDGTACLLVTECKENISYSRIFKLLRALEQKYSDENTSIHIVGFPMLMGWIYSLTPQMYMVFAISILAIAIVLWLIFRNFPGMISPLANAGILTIWGLGFIGFTGINFSPLLYVLAFLVAARMIGNSHQIAYRYFEELDASKGDRKKASYETMRTMWVPNFAAVSADVAGFAVLFIAKIVLMMHLAIIMSFWMATILLTGLLVPLVCSLVPQEVNSEEWAKEGCHIDLMARIMMKITRFSIGPKTRYVTGALILLLTVFCVWETSRLKIGDPTPGSPVFYDSHPYNKDQAVINTSFDASSENFVLYYEGAAGSVYEPVVLNTFESFSRHMEEQLPDIYKSSTSILNIVSMLNFTFHDGDKLWYQLPLNQGDAHRDSWVYPEHRGPGDPGAVHGLDAGAGPDHAVLRGPHLGQPAPDPERRLRFLQEPPHEDRGRAIPPGGRPDRYGNRRQRGDEALPPPDRPRRVPGDPFAVLPLLPVVRCGTHAHGSSRPCQQHGGGLHVDPGYRALHQHLAHRCDRCGVGSRLRHLSL